ncbi:MAG TPA: phosphodiester glycosidase family protein [Longimicrobiales bacterium]
MLLLIALLVMAVPAQAQRVRLTARVAGEDRPLSTAQLRRDLKGVPRLPEQRLHWREAQAGLSWTELDLRAGALRHPLRAIVVRIDPRQFDWQLDLVTRSNGMTGAWNVDSVPDDVVLAFNAGQFKETGPWGWLVMQSYERRDPGYGPISVGIALDSAGALRWLLPRQLPAARKDSSVRFAFQSYPLLLFNGIVPAVLLASNDVDRDHRDARLVLAQRADGTVLVVLTRYEALGGVVQRVPIGLTVPESVVLLAALGARNAVMLDGGISAQLRIRSATETYQWRGLRDVPLALVLRRKAR